MDANSASGQTPQALTASQVLDAPGTPPKIHGAGASGSSAPSATPPASDKISPKLQLLINRERTAVERERAASAKEQAAQAREQAITNREAKIQQFESLKETNPLEALKLLGLDYQKLTQIQMADGKIPAELQVQKVNDRLNQLIQSQEDAKRFSQEASQKQTEQQLEQVVVTFKSEISDYLKENASRYELIAFEQNDDLVYDVIDEHYNRTLKTAVEAARKAGEDPSQVRGEVWTIAQGADKVEQALEQKYDKARNLNKVKALSAPRPMIPNVTKPQLPQRQSPKTLSNTLSATPAAPRKTARTDDERIAAAIAYARGLRPTA